MDGAVDELHEFSHAVDRKALVVAVDARPVVVGGDAAQSVGLDALGTQLRRVEVLSQLCASAGDCIEKTETRPGVSGPWIKPRPRR
ncbi:MAG: hypothetical protein LAP85_22690 [Acidobacteriia bacterium]|nr:hypothetical protein [Terriglobia bacterium]